MLERERFNRQTALTDPGAWRPLLAPLPDDVAGLREVPLRVSMYFRRLEAAGLDVVPRRAEARIRSVRRMLDRIAELDASPLDREREPRAMLVGHCRTSAVLLTALRRDKGIAARARSGFSAYWRQPMRTGHWVTEYWSARRGEWLLADADLDDEWVQLGDLEDGRLGELLASAPAAAPPPEIALDDEAAARFMLDVPDFWRRD